MYTGGQFGSTEFPWVGMIRFICDAERPESHGPDDPDVDGLYYSIIWSTRHACTAESRAVPSKGTGWLWAIFCLYFSFQTCFFLFRGAGALTAYFVIGTAYGVVFLGERGWQALPHSEFWHSIGEFFHSLWENLKIQFGRRGGYQSI